MNREQKAQVVESLKEKFSSVSNIYVTDSSTLTVEQVNKLREICFNKGVEFRVAKNTLIKKAMDATETDFEAVYPHLKGQSALMFSEISNMPAKVLKEFRKDNAKPVLKAAYIDSDVYVGDDQIKSLSELKSKEDLVAEIIGLLQSPAKNVISALQSGGDTLSGLVKALSERTEA